LKGSSSGLKGTGFSLEGTGLSLYIKLSKSIQKMQNADHKVRVQISSPQIEGVILSARGPKRLSVWGW